MARSPESHAYDVSVVVFYKRPLPADAVSLASTTNGRNDFLANVGRSERAVTARVLSTGLNGGELLLERLPGESTDPFDDLRTSQWIMLCGPHPNSNVTSTNPPRGEPRFALNWYQVVTIDREGVGVQNFKPATQRLVTVRGPQWPWTPAANGPWDSNYVSNNLCVSICRGAVAVHSKTIRLEDPRSSEVAFGSGGDPRQIPEKYLTR
jgi:hypothetical protein